MDGSMTAQLEVLKTHADDWASSICQGYLPQNLAWVAMQQNIWASLCHPLLACNFSPQEADSVLRAFCEVMLPGLGICRNVSKAVHHAPQSLLGSDLPDVCTEQGVRQIKHFTTNAHLPNLLGSLHHVCLEQANMEVGIGNVLDASCDHFGFLLTDCLIESIWQFISSNKIQLTGHHEHLKLQCIGDQRLMRLFIDSNLWSKRDLLGMN